MSRFQVHMPSNDVVCGDWKAAADVLKDPLASDMRNYTRML